MKIYVFDTNIVSEIIRRNPTLLARIALETHSEHIVYTCPMVWYEIRRGLLRKDAKSQIKRFEMLFEGFTWQDYTKEDWKLASELWAVRLVKGLPITDADLLIAVYAIKRNAILVTNNEKHFVELGVNVENWTK